MVVQLLADLGLELSDLGDKRFQRKHELSSGLGLELAGAALSRTAQPSEQPRAECLPV
jgi:hypothetical protein